MTTVTPALPDFTRTWLAYIDAACAKRAEAEHTTKLEQANALINRSRGEVHHFAWLYAARLEAEVRS